MLSDYVGEERFLKGVSIYLKKKQYANSVTTDLWEGIQTATGLNLVIHNAEANCVAGTEVGKFMDNWITKVGQRSLPILSFELCFSADGIPCTHRKGDRGWNCGPSRS